MRTNLSQLAAIAVLAACHGGTNEAPVDAASPHADADPMVDARADATTDAPAIDASIDAPIDAPAVGSNCVVSPDPTGDGATLFSAGVVTTGPFFDALGSNGRACATCHDRTAGWSVTPAGIQARFAATAGTDPIFQPIDGATSPDDDCSTLAGRQTAYAMLLAKGLFRIQLSPPAGAEFTVVAVDDPYHYATPTALSLFRRPLPATNLAPDPAIMWDLREPSLAQQATDATLGHEQAGSADPATMAAIAGFETTLATAQLEDTGAGWLDGGGASGGPVALAALPFSPGINDPGASGYDANVFGEYAAWGVASSIARGETIFDTRAFAISGVPGVADNAAATCSFCHDTPGVGSHSLPVAMSLGLDTVGHRTPDMPLYTLQRTSDGTTLQTTDPGYAMTTGKWADVGKFKVPVLRGLAMRAPYFHNGLGSSLASVVSFYDQEFAIGLSAQDQADLVAFLQAL